MNIKMKQSDALLYRAWWRQWLFPLLFLISLWLSLSTYLTLDSIEYNVAQYVDTHQKALVGGDLILTSREPWPAELLAFLQQEDQQHIVYEQQFNAMLHNDDQALLTRVKAVTPTYPLYGHVELASGKALWAQLRTGQIIVEATVLHSLDLNIGDSIKLGDASFTIADELRVEPDQPLNAFGFGARVLMRAEDVLKTQLLSQRSRVNQRIEIASDQPQHIAALKQQLSAFTTTYPAITLQDAAHADTSFTRISDNVLSFLKLLVIAVLLLSGVGLLSIIKTFIQRQQRDNAVRRALGEPKGSIKHSYYRLFSAMAILASIGAIAISAAMLHTSQSALGAILPIGLTAHLSLLSIVKITLLALSMTLLITWQSLQLIAHTKPAQLMQPEAPTQHNLNQHSNKYRTGLWYFSIIAGLNFLIALELGSLTRAVQVTLGLLIIAFAFHLIAQIWLLLLKRLGKIAPLGWIARLAISNIARKNNQSSLFFTTLAAAISVLATVAILNHSIDRQLISNYPESAPNLFLLDVQPEQHDTLDRLIATPVTYYPVIRARIDNVNGIAARDLESKTGFDNPTRTFNLSYAEQPPSTEFIRHTNSKNKLYSTPKQQDSVALSILDTAANFLGVDLGDHITFDVQGIAIKGEITSIRERLEQGPTPFFYFLFPRAVLAQAPQIQFATAKVAPEQIVPLQTTIANTYSGITVINGAAIAQRLQSYVAQLSQLVGLFTALALLAGFLILITSLLSTAQQRLRDSAWFRLLGMRRTDLYRINISEICILGYSATAVGAILATVGSWYIIEYWFALRFSIPWGSFALAALMLSVVLFAIALLYTRFIISGKVMAKIREMI